MQVFKCVYRPLLVHYPQIYTVIDRPGNEELVADHVNCVRRVLLVLIQEFRVFIDLPENDLAVESTRKQSILSVGVKSKDVTLVSVVRVHVSHFADVPNLQTSVI